MIVQVMQLLRACRSNVQTAAACDTFLTVSGVDLQMTWETCHTFPMTDQDALFWLDLSAKANHADVVANCMNYITQNMGRILR